MRNRNMKLFQCLILSLALASCGLLPVRPGRWTHPSNSAAAIKEDHYACVVKAWKQYPKKMGYVSAENGHYDPAKYATTECKYSEYTKKTYCIHTPAKESTWVSSDTVEGDVNAKDRAKEYTDCMTTKDKDYKCIRDGEVVDGILCGQ